MYNMPESQPPLSTQPLKVLAIDFDAFFDEQTDSFVAAHTLHQMLKNLQNKLIYIVMISTQKTENFINAKLNKQFIDRTYLSPDEIWTPAKIDKLPKYIRGSSSIINRKEILDALYEQHRTNHPQKKLTKRSILYLHPELPNDEYASVMSEYRMHEIPRTGQILLERQIALIYYAVTGAEIKLVAGNSQTIFSPIKNTENTKLLKKDAPAERNCTSVCTII